MDLKRSVAEIINFHSSQSICIPTSHVHRAILAFYQIKSKGMNINDRHATNGVDGRTVPSCTYNHLVPSEMYFRDNYPALEKNRNSPARQPDYRYD
ncbi:hypothetical protein CDAR_236561 [Caerostris darwini]|uniref:Uncharacterized protein n=1 Tax=Caerostris darwini TaxID=1538125 RepID=A0AAV4MTK1_9ARAC|nr:hypothetical protein CDAR_236561 [Caerostris darwini]